MKKVNIGIIGVGKWGINYLRTCNRLEEFNVKWIYSRNQKTIDSALRKVNADVKTTVDYKDVLSDEEIDAVAIATPGSTHYHIALEALSSGKHVIVEKPIALSSEKVEELIKASKENDKIVMAGHLHLFNPGILKIKEDIKSGLFGKIKYIHSFGAGNGPVREDMSVAWDYFPHDVSIILYLLDEFPEKVSAQGTSYLNEDIQDVVSMHLTFPENKFTISMATWLYPLKKREVIVVGENIYAVFDDYAKKEKLRYYKPVEGILDGKEYTAQKIDDRLPLTEQLRHFQDCIVNGKNMEEDMDKALSVTKVIESVHESLRKDGVVEIKK